MRASIKIRDRLGDDESDDLESKSDSSQSSNGKPSACRHVFGAAENPYVYVYVFRGYVTVYDASDDNLD